MTIEVVFVVHVLATHAGVLCVFITSNLYVQTFCKDLDIVFDQIDGSLKRNDHSNVKKLNVNAIEFLITIDE